MARKRKICREPDFEKEGRLEGRFTRLIIELGKRLGPTSPFAAAPPEMVLIERLDAILKDKDEEIGELLKALRDSTIRAL